jgi:hypothetical protein
MKNGDTGSSYVSRVGDLQQPWKEGMIKQVECIFGGSPRAQNRDF